MSQKDPLAKFRITGGTDTEKKTKGGNDGGLPPYQAFDARDSNTRLQIRRVHGCTHSPSYQYLLNVSYDGDHGTEIVLTFSFMHVKIGGRNLQNLIKALEKHGCTYIQDYDPNAFAAPTDPAEPFIDLIEVITKGGAD